MIISIIIPFNNNRYLDNCLSNISRIKYNDFEVILINDKPDNESLKIARKFMPQINIKYYETEEDTIGVGNARNLGIEKANGEYIMFVDVDDTIEQDLLNKLNIYVEKNIEMIKYQMKIINKKQEVPEEGVSFDITDGQEGFNRMCFKDKYFDSPCLYLIKKELINRTNLKFEKNVYHEDFGLIPILVVNAKSIVSINFYGYNYYQSDDSIMRNKDYSILEKKVQDKFKHYDNLVRNIDKYNLKYITKTNMLCFYANSIIQAIKDLRIEERKKYIKYFKRKSIARNLIIHNLITHNFFNLIKYFLIQINMEMYFKWQK